MRKWIGFKCVRSFFLSFVRFIPVLVILLHLGFSPFGVFHHLVFLPFVILFFKCLSFFRSKKFNVDLTISMERTGGYILNRREKNNRIENVDKIALQYWSKLHKDHDVTRKIDKSYKHYNVWRICDGAFFCVLWQQPCFANLKLMLIKKKSTNILLSPKKKSSLFEKIMRLKKMNNGFSR